MKRRLSESGDREGSERHKSKKVEQLSTETQTTSKMTQRFKFWQFIYFGDEKCIL
jgi:hypothetical protein